MTETFKQTRCFRCACCRYFRGPMRHETYRRAEYRNSENAASNTQGAVSSNNFFVRTHRQRTMTMCLTTLEDWWISGDVLQRFSCTVMCWTLTQIPVECQTHEPCQLMSLSYDDNTWDFLIFMGMMRSLAFEVFCCCRARNYAVIGGNVPPPTRCDCLISKRTAVLRCVNDKNARRDVLRLPHVEFCRSHGCLPMSS